MSKTKGKIDRAKSPKNMLKKSTNPTNNTLKRIKSSTALLNHMSDVKYY